jgi:hypothetical protein
MTSAWRDPRLLTHSAASSYVCALTLRVMEKQGRESANQLLRKQWPDDSDADTILKAGSNPAMTSVPGWAGALTMQRPADFIGVLAPAEVSPVRMRATEGFY